MHCIRLLPAVLLGTPLLSVRPQLGGRDQHSSRTYLMLHGDSVPCKLGTAVKVCMDCAGHDLVQEPYEAGVHRLHHSRSLTGGHGEPLYGCCLQGLLV